MWICESISFDDHLKPHLPGLDRMQCRRTHIAVLDVWDQAFGINLVSASLEGRAKLIELRIEGAHLQKSAAQHSLVQSARPKDERDPLDCRGRKLRVRLVALFRS